MALYGIDVSYHNGPINWAAVAGDGITYATIKATSGEYSGGTDSPAYFRAQAPAMARHIPLCGGYHWLKPTAQTSAARQVDTFLGVLGQGLGGYRGRLIQLDVEEGQPSDVRAWMAEWHRRTNHYPIAGYLPDWLEDRWPGNDMHTFGFAAWWASEYVAGVGLPYRELAARVTGTQWALQDGIVPTLLQYTSRARVAGVTGNCDVNIYRGTLPQLAAMLTDGEEADMVEFTPEHARQLEEVHRILYEGKRLNDPQTAGGGVPIAWLPRVAQQLGVDLEQLYAEVDDVEEADTRILAAVAAIQAGDPQALAEALAQVLPPAVAQATLDALAARVAG